MTKPPEKHGQLCSWSEAVCSVAQSCPTLCDLTDSSPPGSSVHGMLQVRIVEWSPCPPPGDLPDSGIEPRSPALQADSLPAEPQRKPTNTCT